MRSSSRDISMPGIGSVGSSAMLPERGHRHLAHQVHDHAGDRPGTARAAPRRPPRLPRYATATDANALPRIGSGISGKGGNW